MIRDINDHDIVIIPFFPDRFSDATQPTVFVTLSTKDWRTDLYEMETRDSEPSNYTVQSIAATVSQEVVNIFKAVGSETKREFNEGMIDGGLN